MTEKTRRYFSGASLEAAVMEAARYFGVDPDHLAYERHAKRHGFLRGRRSVVIEVDPDAPGRPQGAEPPAVTPETSQPEAPQPEAPRPETPQPETPQPETPPAVRDRQEPPPASPLPEPARASATTVPPAASRDAEAEPLDDAELEAAVHDALDRVFELTRLDLEADVCQGDEQLEVELSGRDEARLLEDRGALIVSIQHLLPRLVRGITGRSVPCRVDAGGFHEARHQRLLALAERSLADVRRSGQSWVFEPMSPDERRIIHLALADEPDVETESHGRGFFKRVTVRPARDASSGEERYNR